MKIGKLAVLAALFVAPAGAAEDCAIDDLLGYYNLITIEDFISDSDVQGKVFVGGNVGPSAFEIGSSLQNNIPQTETAVEIAGNVPAGGDIKIQAGSLVVDDANSFGGSVTQWNVNGRTVLMQGGNNGAAVTTSSSLTTKKNLLKSQLEALSSNFCAMGDTAASNTFSGGTFTINAKDAEGRAVLNLAASNVFEIQNQNMQLNNNANADFIIINLSGTSVTGAGGINVNFQNSLYSKILWNFCDATNLNLQAIPFRGSLLAPLADVTKSGGDFDGSVAVKSLTTTTEVHYHLLAGSCPPDDSPGEPGEPGIWGDPHIRQFNGEVFDFQGACDLVLLDAPSLNLRVHVRTTMVGDYSYMEQGDKDFENVGDMSYISSAAIQLNDDVMEIGAWGSILINGVYEDDNQNYALQNTFGGLPFSIVRADKKNHEFHLQFGHNQYIKLKSYKKYVGVFVRLEDSLDLLQDSRGLMGTVSGTMIGRDGSTVFSDANEFGQEWQCLPTEPQLFEYQREPQLPHSRCVLPESHDTVKASRRLGEA